MSTIALASGKSCE